MACHVYVFSYCRVMTFVICDMQSEDVAAQSFLWKDLNAVLAKNGIRDSKFKGFMADSAQENSNDVRIIYGSNDTTIPMQNQDRTCFFHWTQTLEKIQGQISEQIFEIKSGNYEVLVVCYVSLVKMCIVLKFLDPY
jgi:hypothetical protein